MTKFLNGASVAAIAVAFGAPLAHAQEQDQAAAERRLNPVTVTATKREESAQDVAVAVTALGEETLEQLDVDVFTDYLVQLPGVTAGGSGPGQSTIYIRGLASTTPNLTTAGVAGLAPNVALYLDEQPVSQPGRNLDIYAVDLERVEVLSGPQGTLFGASSQAGTVRLITNKPNLDEFEASAAFGVSFTEGGEMSNKVEAVVNVPVTDKFALRGVVYADDQGGYIDNVQGTRSAIDSGRFRPFGTPRANGIPVGSIAPLRAGFQSSPEVLAAFEAGDVTFIEADNTQFVEDDFNDTTYAGFRVSGLYEFNDDWRLTVSHARQSLESEGVFFTDPELDDLEIERFSPDEIDDDYSNTAWTLEGRLGVLEAVYTGAFTDRQTDQQVDYTDYLFVGQYLPYYICDASVTAGGDAPTGTCQAPNLFVDSVTNTDVLTQELRFNTPDTWRLRGTFGAFYSDLELVELNDFFYPGSLSVVNADGSLGFGALPPNFPLTNGAATPGDIGDESDGFFSDPGPLPPGGVFRNDILRTDEQIGVFGEATFDLLPDTLSLTFGVRYFNVDVDFEGSANSAFDILFPATGPDGEPVDAQTFGTNLSTQFAPDNPFGAPDSASTEGVIFKGNASWTPTDDLLFYFTFSEGFRPGLLNRPGGAVGLGGDFTVPFELETDEVQNFEIGWKTTLFNNQLQFNGNAFLVEIDDLQTTIFDPSITNLFFSDNAANAEIMGIEADFIYAPRQIEGLTVTGAFSVLDTEVTEVLTPTEDVIEGSDLAFAPSFQANLRARYEWDVLDGQYTAHVMPQLAYAGESFTDIIAINSIELDDWFTLGLSGGLTADNWSIEAFAENLTDERAEISGNFVFDQERITVIRPRTYGIRVGVQY